LHQFRLAETEKYPHVTFFLNGGREEPFCGETRRMVPSPAVATYDLQPEMSCPEVSDVLCDAIASGQYDLIVVNYANPDMVGHSGVLTAAITACESVDKALGEMMGALDSVGGCAVICADHGNCETMVDIDTGKPHTAHTTNLVPVILFGSGVEGVALRDGGSLADIAPTLLHLMGIDTPEEMSGECLVFSD
ncbi:MAG: 2,3-bisphosphoglycerate-independent phosphoglycerate mutase, partial [Proteobacteria bacterium]|nr:2,3-bisphosphoglycerate-independent phosphoglycerate mutase [Pseudomonadota bacterium]